MRLNKLFMLILCTVAFSGLAQYKAQGQNITGARYGSYDDAINFMQKELPLKHKILGWPDLRSDWFLRTETKFYEISWFTIWNEYLILTIREGYHIYKSDGKSMEYKLGEVKYLNINLNDTIELETVNNGKKGSSNHIRYRNIEIDHRGEKELDARYRKNKDFDRNMVQLFYNHLMVLKKTANDSGINSDNVLADLQMADDKGHLLSVITTENIKSIVQNATEIKEFQKIVDNYNAQIEKPAITEEQRKYIVQANALNEERNYGGALQLYQKAVKINQVAYPQAYYNMALIAAQGKNYNFAILNMKKYLMLVPDAEDARAAQDKIYEWELKMNK